MAIALLLAQAISDLNLPNFMSKIVNIGIQQGGIESGVPDAISAEGFEFMKITMSAEQRLLMDSSYVRKTVADTDSHGKSYGSTYPGLQGKDLYVLIDHIPEEKLAELEQTFGTAIWTVINVMRSAAEQGAAGSPGAAAGAGGATGTMPGAIDIKSVDITQLYKTSPMLEKLPAEALKKAATAAQALDASMLKQTATMLSGIFYKELGVDMAAYQSRYIISVGLLMLLIALASGLATVLVSFISSRIAAGVARNLRNDIFERVEKFSNAEYDKFSTASLITRSTNDVMQIQMLLAMGIRMLCYAPIMGIGGVFMALNKSVSMSWIIAVACLLLVGLISLIFSLVMPKFKSMQKLIDRLNLVARETLNGLMVIRAFGTESFEKDRFDGANKDLARTNLFVTRTMTFMMPAMMLIMNGTSLLVIWNGSHQIAQSTMQVGDMMAFMQYSMQIIMSFLMVSMMFIFIPRASVSGQRIVEVLETEPTITDPQKPQSFSASKKGVVEFKNVCFKYSGAEENALQDINIIAHPGQTTAFIGATGSGKSTLVNLIPRFYDVTSGEVLVGGVNVRNVAQKDLRAKIGYVPQKSVLMSGTIQSNITYGNESATDAEIRKVSEVAQALDFITKKEEGFGSEISQGGANVSGGQKQRLSIARALAVKPDIYIFDDSFSALDFKTDAELRKALKAHTGGSTVIIVAQRISTIMDANMIYVIDGGKVVGQGTHSELLESCPEYYEIASSQLSAADLKSKAKGAAKNE